MSADRITALADSGTPGPWFALPGDDTFNPSVGAVPEAIPSLLSSDEWVAECKPDGGADAAKIVAAVNALPKVAAYDAAVKALQVHQALCTGPYLCEGCEEAWDDVHAARADLYAALGVDSE